MKTTQNENKLFWDERARKFTGHSVSWPDVDMKSIEMKTVMEYIDENDHVIDIGCSNGQATYEMQKVTKASFLGVDYSKNSIKQAYHLKNGRLKFEFGDILDMAEKHYEQFDKAVTIRCLINLMNWQLQKKSLINVHKLLKPGGTFIMCEAFHGGLVNINRLRRFFKLAPLLEPDQNYYFREKRFESFITQYFTIKKIIRHSSLYYIGTRCFQYLTRNDNPDRFGTALHSFFAKYNYETNHSGDFSPQKAYILVKK